MTEAFGVFRRRAASADEAPEAPFEEPTYEILPVAELNRLAELFRRKAESAGTPGEEREWTGRERNCRAQVNRIQRTD
jgi:hypothetical protein